MKAMEVSSCTNSKNYIALPSASVLQNKTKILELFLNAI